MACASGGSEPRDGLCDKKAGAGNQTLSPDVNRSLEPGSPIELGGPEIKSVSLDSRMEHLQYNPGGSIDLYIGAEAPEGLESNFMKTVGEDGWFVYFRLYAPTEPFFDKTYSLPDFEMID